MADLVRTGQVPAAELREACLALIAERDPLVHAVAELGGPQPAGPSGGAPFPGVPFAVKDHLPMPGLRWTMGSRLMAATPPPDPLPPYSERLLAAGLQVVASTRSSEFGLLGSAEGLLHGEPTRNPWGAGLSPAGSSGGSAALVAAGVVPMAHASDGGGSIRVPASVTGLFGFKPSNGRTAVAGPAEGLAALVADHCVSRSVADSAALLAATERTGPGAPWPAVGRIEGPSGRRLWIGVVERTLLGALPDPAVRDELTRARELCEDLGHHTVALDAVPVDGKALSDAFFTIAALTMAAVGQSAAAALGRPPGPDELEPFTLELIDLAATLPPDAAARCDATLRAGAAAYVRLFDDVDAILTPTLARPPWEIGHLHPGAGRETLVRRTEEIVGYTPIHNMSASPAMSVPLGTAGGLPVGMQFAAAPGEDALLLDLAFALEEAAPWRERRPDLQALAAPA